MILIRYNLSYHVVKVVQLYNTKDYKSCMIVQSHHMIGY